MRVVVHRHPDIAMPHLRLPVGKRHSDLFPERGVSMAEHMPTQPRYPKGCGSRLDELAHQVVFVQRRSFPGRKHQIIGVSYTSVFAQHPAEP